MTRATNAAVDFESINTRFHCLNSKLEVIIILFCSYQSEINLNNSSDPSLVKSLKRIFYQKINLSIPINQVCIR